MDFDRFLRTISNALDTQLSVCPPENNLKSILFWIKTVETGRKIKKKKICYQLKSGSQYAGKIFISTFIINYKLITFDIESLLFFENISFELKLIKISPDIKIIFA